MESFSRIDIFDTKGIEYLFVIGYLLILIVFWQFSGKQVKITRQIQKALGSLTAAILKVPQGIFYSKQHTWAHLERTGVAKVGLDDFLQHLTGEVKIRHVRDLEEDIRKGDLLTEVEQDGKKLSIYSPISGTVVNKNGSLSEAPSILNEDPYEAGWLYEIKPSRWQADTSTYMLGEEATEWAKKELERFKDFMAGAPMEKFSTEPAMVVLQDGGEMRDNILAELPEDVWNDFQKEFLDAG